MTTISEAQLRQSFKQQCNSDGTMDLATFQMILKSLHLDPTDYAVHEAVNEASSGLVIEEKDLSKFLEILARNQNNAKDLAVNLRQIFDLIDADKNGFLDRYEIKMAFALLNKEHTNEDVEDLMAEADLDKDGRISFDEFLASKKSRMFYNLKLQLGNGN